MRFVEVGRLGFRGSSRCSIGTMEEEGEREGRGKMNKNRRSVSAVQGGGGRRRMMLGGGGKSYYSMESIVVLVCLTASLLILPLILPPLPPPPLMLLMLPIGMLAVLLTLAFMPSATVRDFTCSSL